jgi:hypothetical protein
LILEADGRATLYSGGADDRLVGRPAIWRDGDAVRPESKPGTDVHVVTRSADRLVVRIA